MYEMDHGLRSSDGFIKKKSSSGCLIVKKRIGSSTGPVPRKFFGSTEEQERLNTGVSISGSSEDSLEQIKRGCIPRGDKFNDGSGMYGKGISGNSGFGRKEEFEGERWRALDKNDELHRKRIRKDDSQERYGIRRTLDIDSTNNPYVSTGYADEVRSTVSPLRRTFHVPANKVIRVQGKSGVLKVMVHKSKNIDILRKYYDFQMEDVNTFNKSGSKSELAVNTNLSVGPSNYLGLKHRETANSSIRIEKCEPPKLQNSLCKTANASVWETTHKSYDYHHQGSVRRDSNLEIGINKNSRTPVSDLDPQKGNSSPVKAEKSVKLQNSSSKRAEAGDSETKESDVLLKSESTCMVKQKKNMLMTRKSNDNQQQDLVRRGSKLESNNNKNGNLLLLKAEKSESKLQNLPSKRVKSGDTETENSDSSLNLEQGGSSLKGVKGEEKTSLPEKVTLVKCKETKVKRGTGTEKQLLREKIRHKLLSAGWKIEYRPRKNRDYLDAVYTNPSGTAYWSIIKAYEAFKKLMGEEDVPAELLNKLTRQTRKKMEKERMMKQREEEARSKKGEDVVRGEEGVENNDNNGKLGVSQKPNGKLLKRKAENSPSETNSYLVKERKIQNQSKDDNDENLNLLGNPNGKLLKQKAEKPPAGTNSHLILERKSQKNGDDESSILSPKHNSMSLKLKAEKPPIETNSHLTQESKSQQISVSTLLIRSFDKGSKVQNDGYVLFMGKRTVLSWLIDSKTVEENKKVQYMNRKRTQVMVEGYITKDGIRCGCCGKVVTVSKFELHAGSKLQNPFQNMFLESGVSLFQCQMEAWSRQDEAKKRDFYNLKIDGDDGNDDACGVCGDGGDMICCDGCPSTFHQSCLGIQMLPSGDWHCPNCTCRFCEKSSAQGNALLTCRMCERKYHKLCGEEIDAFCGKKCQEMFNQLLKLLEIKHELGEGYSWSLIHRTNIDTDATQSGFEQKVECNSKLAVALSVIEECFLPINDRRSGINLIHNVLYNRGSNYSRLNHGGFYTAILERGDEIIAAASIRIHGTQLAEMPFIGIRHVYRRQGMCRRLLSAIESALASLKVEKLVIPAVAGNLRTWTGSFGFNTLEKSDKKEMRPLKLLVFPRTDMLQKKLMAESRGGAPP